MPNNLPTIVAAFDNKLYGKDLFNVTDSCLKELGINTLDRVRFSTAFVELSRRWTLEEELERDGNFNFQELSVTTSSDDRSFHTIHHLFSKKSFVKAVLTAYYGTRKKRNRGRNQDLEEVIDGPQRATQNEPLFQIEMKDVHVSSLYFSSGGGENIFNSNLSLYFRSFSYKGQFYPFNTYKYYANYYPLPCGSEVSYDFKKNESYYREWGKVLVWNHSSHYTFPREFQEIVKTMLLVHGRCVDGNYLQYLPDSTLDIIFYFLSYYYIPTSPFRDQIYPGPDEDIDNI